jgi:inhibitor of cysteine peptidase
LQREIKNKTVTFGIAALLLAVILTATVYNFGIQTNLPEKEGDLPPQAEEPTEPETPSVPNIPQEPSTQPSPSDSPSEPEVPEQPDSPPILSELKTFSSYEELESFLTIGMEEAIQSENLARFNVGVDDRTFSADTVPAGTTEVAGGSEYSTTNVQVAGVDEADIVKSDGEFLYVISGQTVYILKAYPPDQAEVLSKIELDDTYDAQIYVNENRLVVLGSLSPYITYGFAEVTTEGLWINPSVYNEEVFLRIYDITNRADPVLSRTVTLHGTLSGSRMIGDYVYAVVRQLATQPSSNGTGVDAVLPMISGDFTKEVQPTEIRYVDTPDVYYYMTTIIAVNVMNDAEEPTDETFLTGQTTTMYVSLNNMYLVVPNTNVWILSANGEEPKEETIIFRIALDQEKVVAMAEGAISGNVKNQFSMDEYNGFFRVATTTNEWWDDGIPKNHLFILDMSLTVIGSLEDLAPGETIYSTRFVGDRGYVVTFRKIDPLFVIDLTEPANPTVLGQLKVTGYSDYLHPYDENHLIGIGKETEAAEEGDFAWYQGVKMSLFDVSEVSNPVMVSNYTIGDRGTDSPVLSDHKALLFDRDRNLLVMPVLVAEIDPNDYAGEVSDNTYGAYVWQGAYVFDISLDNLELRGEITHLDDNQDLLKSGYWFYSEYSVERSLYIDNVLYTISDRLVKMNDLESLNLLKVVEFS